jgi:hypothetical protein
MSEVLAQLAVPLKQISVASDEIESLGIAAIDRFGLRSRLELEHRLVVWSMCEPVLESPATEVLRIWPRKPDRIGQMRLIGEQALPWRRYDDGELPRRLAIHQRLLKSLNRSLLTPEREPATEAEIWDRCPARLSPGAQRADILSL